MVLFHEDPAGALPDFPVVGRWWRDEDHALIVESSDGSRRATLNARQAVLDGLAGSLGLASGGTALGDLLDGMPSEVAAEVTTGLRSLAEAGLLEDARRRPEHLLGELQRITPGIPAEQLASIQKRGGWRDARARKDLAVAIKAAPLDGAPQRQRSLPLGPGDAPGPQIHEHEVADLLAATYRTDETYKPVASAGRIWPVVLHAWFPASSAVWWFNPDGPTLEPIAHEVTADAVANSVLQPGLVRTSAARRRPMVILSLDLDRIGAKYGNRGTLYGLMEVGAVSHQITLAAGVQGARARMVCGFSPKPLRTVLGIAANPVALVFLERTT